MLYAPWFRIVLLTQQVIMLNVKWPLERTPKMWIFKWDNTKQWWVHSNNKSYINCIFKASWGQGQNHSRLSHLTNAQLGCIDVWSTACHSWIKDPCCSSETQCRSSQNLPAFIIPHSVHKGAPNLKCPWMDEHHEGLLCGTGYPPHGGRCVVHHNHWK